MIRSWLELAAHAFEKEGNDLDGIAGWVADSGEGRWTVADASEHDVPAPIITLALIQRLRSRRSPDSFTDRVLAALRNEFGGHAVKSADPRTRPTRRMGLPEPWCSSRWPPPRRRATPRQGLRQMDARAMRDGHLRGHRDLTRRKLAPAIYNLALGGFLPPEFTVVGFARRPMTNAEFHEHLREGSANSAGTSRYPNRYGPRSPRASSTSRATSTTRRRMRRWPGISSGSIAIGHGGNRIFYLAIQPSLVPEVVSHLGAAGLAGSPERGGGRRGWTRVVIEKPFGFDATSAETLNRQISEVFAEEQIYRIDHYLGKETVQNLAVFRFGNGLFEPIWNRRYIDSVQITVAETVGLEGRGEFYDETGALRDIVQNHVLQLLAVFAMEPPVEFARTISATRSSRCFAR